MAVTQLYNKIELREHPDLSPIDDDTFQKTHSFIFPGDEIVFCTKLNCPSDIGGNLNGVILESIKCSVIAKKPNVFSSVFSSSFASTRSFELESFILPINSSNAPIINFDGFGYAPNITFKQDRNWQLASGDFRRQINFFTNVVDSDMGVIPQWNFYYPVIFREEYWQALNNADNDFYDSAQFNDGKNEKWDKYNTTALGWKIFYKLELNYSKFGIKNTIFSELNLSNEQIEIQDYNQNSDFSLKSIKTCNVGGTPINSPFAPIFDDKNTSCFAYFTKNTSWATNERSKLTAIFRIRPQEIGDQSEPNRVSSKYAGLTTDVWVKKKQHLITNSGLKIKTNNGKYIVTNQAIGGGCIISFDPLNDKKIIIYAEIDYKKLKLKYPGIIKFTLYCRLFNNTIYT